MFDQVPSNMQTSSSSPSSSHSSSEMYYTNVLFGHPLFAPSVLIRRSNENDSHTRPSTTQSERTSPLNDDFIDLDVVSDSAPTLSGDEADQPNIPGSLPTSLPTLENRVSSPQYAFYMFLFFDLILNVVRHDVIIWFFP